MASNFLRTLPVLAVGFANPWLLGGLALGAVPILIHLFHARTYRETDWAAMRFLIEAARKNSRRTRLEQIVLLAVRTLALLLIAAAFADPLVEAMAPAERARAPVHRIVVVDASFSMGHANAEGTCFERAKRIARQIVAGSLAGDAVNVLRISGRSPRAIVREAAFEPEPVLAEIDRLTLTDEPGDLFPTVSEAAEILADPRAPNKKEVIFISDFQQSTWAAESSAGLAEIRTTMQRMSDRAAILLIDVGDEKAQNAAVTSIRTVEPIALVDRPTRLRAGLRNFGRAVRAAERVELYVDGGLAAYKSIKMPAASEAVVEFSHEFRTAGDHAVEVRLPADGLAADDQRWLSVPVADHMNVLVVNGRPSSRPAESAAYFVRTVLAPSTTRDAWSGVTQPKVISEADLAAEDLARYDCVFLCNVALVTPTEAALLQAYTEGGGGLVLVMGDRVKSENYNALLDRDGTGVLPVPLGSRVGDARDSSRGGFTFDAGDLQHPILAPFRGNPKAGLERPVTLEYVQTKIPPGSAARVALRFDSGDPAIVERQFGRGRSVLVTTSADVSWSTWAVHPTFPPIIHEIVRFVSAGRSNERQRQVGEALTRTLSAGDAGARVQVKSPDGKEQNVRPVQTGNKTDILFAATDRRGIYEMTIGSGGDRRELYAVNVDPRESDLTSVDEKGLRSTALAGVPFTRRTEWSEVPRDTADSGAESSGLASWLLIATLGLLLVEPLLAWSFRHGFLLLCVMVAAGFVVPAARWNGWGGLILGIVLSGGIVTIAWWSRRPNTRGRSTSRRFASLRWWNRLWNRLLSRSKSFRADAAASSDRHW